MLLYAHPVNDERAARGAPIINSVWLHGTGSLPERSGQAIKADSTLIVAEQLRAKALAQDWPAWGCAWQELDATVCADLLAQALRGDTVRLTLCGQRQARSWVAQATDPDPPPQSAVRRRPRPHTAGQTMNIIPRQSSPRAAWALEQAGVHPLLAQLYAARGVTQPRRAGRRPGQAAAARLHEGRWPRRPRCWPTPLPPEQAPVHRGRLRLRRRHRLRRGRARPAPAGRHSTWTTSCRTAWWTATA